MCSFIASHWWLVRFSVSGALEEEKEEHEDPLLGWEVTKGEQQLKRKKNIEEGRELVPLLVLPSGVFDCLS